VSASTPVIVLATSNTGKIAEFRALLAGLPIEVVSAGEVLDEMPPVVEDGDTFAANALKKARAVAEASLMLTLADDSGLEVDVLDGAPGVRSARYAGECATDGQNNARLLEALRHVPSPARSARFRCVVVVVDPWAAEDGLVRTEGTCEGIIARSPRGSGGFGYDPLFVVGGGERTMAELSDGEKNAISHRAQAVKALRPLLLKLLDDRAATTDRVSFSASRSSIAERSSCGAVGARGQS
jgi:XTP/dITP diphosphohydrolase